MKLRIRLGTEKANNLEAAAWIMVREYASIFPKLIDETKRNYIFMKGKVKIIIPKEVISERDK